MREPESLDSWFNRLQSVIPHVNQICDALNCPRCGFPTETRTVGRWDPPHLCCTHCTWSQLLG